MLTEAVEIAEELGNSEIRVEAMAWRVPAFVALCDMESAKRQVAVLREAAEQTAQPFMLHVAEHYGSALALCDGRLGEAELLAGRSHEWGRLLGVPERLDEAAELYRRYDAGRLWLERVEADRRALS